MLIRQQRNYLPLGSNRIKLKLFEQTEQIWVAATNNRGHSRRTRFNSRTLRQADLTEDTLSCQTWELSTLMIQQDTIKLPETNRAWVKQPVTEDTPSDQI